MASSLKFNTIAGAVLTAGIIASGSGVISRILYHPSIPEEPAYHIELAEGGEGEGGGAAEEEATPLPVLLASADAGSGESDTKVCTSCHSFDQGGASKVGPPLWGVVGRDIASVDGFAYSSALTDKEGDWTYEHLDSFIANPKDWAPGTKMSFAGVSDPEDRADLLVYLQSLADDPVPLPEPEEQPADEGEQTAEGEQAAPAEGGGEDQTSAAEEQPAEGGEQAAASEGAAPAEGEGETQTAAAEEQSAEGGEQAAAASEQAAPAEGDDETQTAAASEETGEGDAAPADQGGAAGGGGQASGFVAMVASADVGAGETYAKRCSACHTFDEGGANRVGPHLHGVVGRDIGSVEGFSYSDALTGLEGEWTVDKLDGYLADPKGYAPGNKMAFAGVKDEEDRANLIAYLRSVSPDAPPLPGG